MQQYNSRMIPYLVEKQTADNILNKQPLNIEFYWPGKTTSKLPHEFLVNFKKKSVKGKQRHYFDLYLGHLDHWEELMTFSQDVFVGLEDIPLSAVRVTEVDYRFAYRFPRRLPPTFEVSNPLESWTWFAYGIAIFYGIAAFKTFNKVTLILTPFIQ